MVTPTRRLLGAISSRATACRSVTRGQQGFWRDHEDLPTTHNSKGKFLVEEQGVFLTVLDRNMGARPLLFQESVPGSINNKQVNLPFMRIVTQKSLSFKSVVCETQLNEICLLVHK